MQRIFLIGPGGVGKTTVGRLLAVHLGYELLDLDEEFCSRVRPIRNYLDAHGYPAYVRRNSELFHKLLALYGPASKTVFVLSSGFLATDVEPETVARNRTMVQAAGISVLLMPSRDLAASLEVVLARQMGRVEPRTGDADRDLSGSFRGVHAAWRCAGFQRGGSRRDCPVCRARATE
jgi:shikimate kinase